jgi:hypothetical protein
MPAGPFISAAFLCEKVLREGDGVPTFVRVVERFTVPVMPKLPLGVQIPAPPAPIVQCSLVVLLKAGDVPAGRYTVRIDHVPPTGSQARGPDAAAVFNGGDDNGSAIISQMAIPNPPEGLHWFDFYFEQERLTRIPMRIIYQPMQVQFTQQPSPGLPRR